ncbi:MAG: glycosyltransferase [Bacilli bacterium]|nr:glycosyltransferase [Bacilli bacterium]
MKKYKRILHLLPSNSFSGAENVVCNIIQNNKKYEMFYCCPRGPIEKVLKEKNIDYIPINKFNLCNIKKIINRYDIDIVHAHDFKASFLAGFLKNVTVISHLHNNPPFIKKWNIYTFLYSLVSTNFSKVAVVSDAVYNESVFKKKIKDKYFVISNVVNKKEILKMAEEKYETNYDFGFIGRITEQKNPLLIIEIVKKIKLKNPNIKVVMIGSGDLERKCHELINLYELEDNFDMIGFSSNPFKILNNCNFVIMPSVYEGFGLTAIESMCLNKPVLNSGVGGLASIFENNKDFICSSIDEYVYKSLYFLSDKSFYSKYKEECKKIIQPYVDIDAWMNRIYSLYEDVVR